MAEAEESALEATAGEQLGVSRWDRPAILRESADAATDNGLPYWTVLLLSGAIAALGLALNSSAVLIGAMLVAPLLAPVVGLAVSLAVGDARLAVQTGAVVAGSTLAVIAVSAVLTLLLPFHTITLEISARTRPTTLDLAIAIFSGLVGAVVTVARGSRLSAAIPGVAISVALIPPLAVAGFGIAVGWRGDIIRGSMLLYGANLAGIVLSGMAVFLLVGMHRGDVVEAARRWHREGRPVGMAAWVDRARWVRSLDALSSVGARIGLVGAFVVALGLPLSQTLGELAREVRVERAVEQTAARLFDIRDRASILSRQVVYGSGRTQVYLRVATTDWFGQEQRDEFERRASAVAGEPVRLSLEQLPARGEDIEQLASLLPGAEQQPVRPPPPPPPTGLGELLTASRLQLQQVGDAMALPQGLEVVGLEIRTTDAGAAHLRIAYAGEVPLQSQAAEILRGQIARALDAPGLQVALDFISTEPRPLAGSEADTVALRALAEALQRGERLALELTVPEGDGAARQDIEKWLNARGIRSERIRVRNAEEGGMRARVLPVSEGDGAEDRGPS